MHVEFELWGQCIRSLEDELPEHQFNTWVRPLQAVEGVGALKLLAPNRLRRRLGECQLVGADRGSAAQSKRR